MSTGRRVDVPNAAMLQIHLSEERDPEIRRLSRISGEKKIVNETAS